MHEWTTVAVASRGRAGRALVTERVRRWLPQVPLELGAEPGDVSAAPALGGGAGGLAPWD